MELNYLHLFILILGAIKLTNSCPTLCKCSHKEVNCYKVGLNAVPTGIPSDTVLINLETNQISEITIHSFRELSELKVLRLASNKINKVEEGAFNDLQHLIKLDLARNDIAELPRGIFSELKTLEILDLYENKLDNIDGLFKDLKHLEKLALEKNAIKEIKNDTFKDLTKLRNLKLSNNNISKIESGAFQANPKLTIVALDSNPIQNIDGVLQSNLQVHYLDLENCTLSKLPQGMPWTVKYLKLSRNNITQITKAETQTYAFLSIIILEDNHLSYVEKGAFSHMGFLSDVFLIKNDLDSIPGPFPQSVRSLYLDKNKIASIPTDSFQHGTSLSVLSLRSNQIREIPPHSFANLLSIRELHLERNPFDRLLDNVFLLVRGLRYMSFNHLHLRAIYNHCFLGLDTMEKLELSFIDVPPGKIHGNPFLSTPNLRVLTLQESPNLAQHILQNDHILNSLGNLTSINLMDNHLKTLKPTFQTALPDLNEIKLSGNPFLCDTNLIWLKKWMSLEPEKFDKPRELICYQPQHLHGTAILDISINDFLPADVTAMNHEQAENVTNSYSPVDTMTEDNYTYYYYDTHISNYDTQDQSTDYDFYDHYDDHYDTKSVPKYTSFTATTSQFQPSTRTGGDSNINKETSPQIQSDNSNNSNEMLADHHFSKTRGIVLAISMSVGVIFLMLLIAGTVYCFWIRKRRAVHDHDQVQHYKTTDDYVFIVSKKDTEVQSKTGRRLTREERGSTTSKASEDITNSADPTMKVYMLND